VLWCLGPHESVYLLRFRFGLAGTVKALAQRSTICLVPSVTTALAWRFDSAVARPRAEPMAALAPLGVKMPP
jgi:hypothetical protein